MRHLFVCALAVLTATATASGQIGLPGGGSLPFPRKGKKTDKAKQQQMEMLKGVRGMLRQLSEESLILESEDKRIMLFSQDSGTKYFKGMTEIKPETLEPGDHVLVEFGVGEDGKYFAGRITLEKSGTAQEKVAARVPVASIPKSYEEASKQKDEQPQPAEAKAEAGKPVKAAAKNKEKEPEEIAPTRGAFNEVLDATTQVTNQEDGPPKLVRGRPAPRKKSAANDDIVVVATSGTPNIPAANIHEDAPPIIVNAQKEEPTREADPLIEKAKETSESFLESLPNYTVKQLTTRYQSTTIKTNWQAQDNISIDLIYSDGKEIYKNVMLNGKASKGKAEETGSWSTGEFGSTIRDLFSPSTQADFRPLRASETIAGRTAAVYSFYVKQETSHWRVIAPGESFSPAYRGSVWIDKETGRALRVEMQSRNVPKDFPIDKVETVIDYEFIRLGAGKFLLPVKSESLSCFRGTTTCTKNIIEFRNYRKFGAESAITFTP